MARMMRSVQRSMRGRLRRACLALSLMSCIYLLGSNYSSLHQYSGGVVGRRNLRLTTADTVKPYSQDDIIKTAPYFPKFVPRLLVFDGLKFQAFGLAHRGTQYFETMRYTYRYIDTFPLLVQALKTNFPERFKPGSPPFELLFSDADSPHSDCENNKCPTEDFAPMVLFGSTPKDDSIYPTLRSFPHPVFAHCLFHYKVNGVETCDWPQKPRTDIPWEQLTETVVWRGADWPFLHYQDRFRFEGPNDILQRLETPEWKTGNRNAILDDLTANLVQNFSPRWRGALMSAQTQGDATPWIDTKFVGGMNTEIHAMLSQRGVNVTGERMDAPEMSNYKYQIDYGGGGGTTWEGTLTKLLMPGVLFHHETETKDWYYDMMIPWKHYVPISWDLSDLWSSFQSAQTHGEQMKQISAEGTRLAEYMMSADYMEDVYQELFVNYLGKLVNSYQPPTDGSTWANMAEKYKEKGFDIYSIGVCKEKVCSVLCRKGIKSEVLFINSDKPAGTRGGAAQQAQPQPQSQPEYQPPKQQWQPPPQQQQPPPQQETATARTLQQWQPPPQQQQWQPPPQQQQQWQPPPQQQQQPPPQQQQQQPWKPPPQDLQQPQSPAQRVPPTSQQEHIPVPVSRYITEPKVAVQQQILPKAAEAAEGETKAVQNKAHSYIAGMAAPEPTPAPILYPTEPPVRDRSSMYISGAVDQPAQAQKKAAKRHKY